MGRHQLADTHKAYQIEQMWEVHHEICRLTLIGMKQVDIANHLGVSPAMVSYVLRSPIVKEQLRNMSSSRDIEAMDIDAEIKALAPTAVKVMEELMDSELPNMRLKAAQDILDRAGFAPVKTLRTENLHAYLSADEIKEVKDRAREVGLITDVIFKEVTDADTNKT